MEKPLLLSVIICTFNRAELLKQVLDSLTLQTIAHDKFEVIIIDDGSTDNTREIADFFSGKLPIKYFYQKNAGLASAKNHGTYASQGKIVLFLDDDDVATPTLLEEHIKTHEKYPKDHYAVLHLTTWSPEITVTPLMHFITEIGCFLFSYPHIKHGNILDYTYFWGGRTSCKRSFLLEHGVFNPVFRFGCEDIELAYRLSWHGLKVVFNSKAVSMMIRPLSFDDFCNRLIRQGNSQYIFSTLHNDQGVHTWSEVIGAEEKWYRIKNIYNAKIRASRELDKVANMKLRYKLDIDDVTKKLLYESYWWSFKACKIKGIVEAMEDSKHTLPINQQNNQSYSTNTNMSLLNVEASECLQNRGNSKIQKTKELKFVPVKVASYEDYKEYASGMAAEYSKRELYESSLNKDKKKSMEGYCYVCKQKSNFNVDYLYAYKKNGILTPNWRESLICQGCCLNNRMRASIHLFETLLHANRDSKIYISEQTTPLYKWFADNYPHVTGSEYLGGIIPFGTTNKAGIRNESLTQLTFSDNQFDFTICFDIFEHIPNYRNAFRECFRILKPEGVLFFTVPFDLDAERNIIRAVITGGKEIQHILPPEYHGDPMNTKGCLSFYIFGWEILNELKETGFTDVSAYLNWSNELGYLGREQAAFVAKKNKSI